MIDAPFQPSLFEFLDELTWNNRRDWFQQQKSRYEREVREPCLEFVRAMRPELRKISSHFMADDRRVGGSLMRIYRDTRFAKDKRPYKTNVGIQFRHELGKDVHAPGFYVHIEPDQSFLGVGIWHPDAPSLKAIRAAIDESPTVWKRACNGRVFRESFTLAGDRLKTAPRGYAKDHPLIDDLARKDFIAVQSLTDRNVLQRNFLPRVVKSFRDARPFMKFLCEAVNVPF